MVSLSLELRTPPLVGFGRRTVDPSAKQRLRQASEQSKQAALVFCLSNFTTTIKDEGEAHDDHNDENDDDDNDER